MKYLAFIPLLLIVTLIFLPHQSDAKPNQVIEDIRALAESELDAQLKEAQFEQAPDYISIRAGFEVHCADFIALEKSKRFAVAQAGPDFQDAFKLVGTD